uniref:CCHC-type domain-containing protein n=1 Tax=Chromera velia CCMP2878 TaxID=1169474 RepID=A0A0G4HQB2_9ALVE|eukprot:Cvel_7914.t1-p1 / transcript=Cvel_7914.t1 / gene=Cvel_7914 / organism=Chromera_velia_CCMP2878 / gene_product=hypothetical protein / transcript_product=hypothetical protein / location=Cvel_scaffold424:50996-52226(-) / protein_length=275 / sequence_SO=supercontig / SO=protein_coding / is_pseudo=false
MSQCKTVHGDESAPQKGGLAPKKQGDIRAVVKEEIALFVGGGMGLPRKEKPNNTRPPKKSNNSCQPKGNPVSNSEKKCWRCGQSSCKNPNTCKSLKEGNECKCCGRLGHWKPTCRCSKCMAEKNAAPPKSKKKQTVNHVRGDPGNLAFDRSGEMPSYFDVRDVCGIIHRIIVDAPNGHCCSHIPSFPLPVNAKKREAEFDREWGGGRQALCVQHEVRRLDMEEARVEHNRLGIHSGAEYFGLTLEEDGKSITAAWQQRLLPLAGLANRSRQSISR